MGSVFHRLFGSPDPPPRGAPGEGEGGQPQDPQDPQQPPQPGGEDEQQPPEAEDQLPEDQQPEEAQQPPPDQPAEQPQDKGGEINEEKYKRPLSEVVKQRYHNFSMMDVKREMGDPIVLPQTYQRDNNERLVTIEKCFKTLLDLRSEINDLLMGFKQRIDVPNDTDLSKCFRKWARQAGPYATFHVNMVEMTVAVEDADEDVAEAADKFSMMLEKCKEFEEKVDNELHVMNTQLTELENSTSQIQDTKKAISRTKQQLELVNKWKEEIIAIPIDTVQCKKALEYVGSASRQVIREVPNLQ